MKKATKTVKNMETKLKEKQLKDLGKFSPQENWLREMSEEL